MTFTIPTAVHLMQVDWDLDARSRGQMAEGQWNTRNTKSEGSLPLTGANAMSFVNTDATGSDGVWTEFLATGGYDVSADTKIAIVLYQHNAPNRLEINTNTNNGMAIRLGTGTGTPTTDYRTWQFGGQDTGTGKERAFPVHVVIDMNDQSFDAEAGTYDNTDVETFGILSDTVNMGGSTTMIFHQRTFVFDTTKNATDIPRFTGTNSDWDDVITALGTAYNTKISHGWLGREGTIFSIACPIEIGDNSTATTFNDNGVSVFWPDHNEPGNPRVRVTNQAFRFYLNLRNNASDTATFSGFYDAGNSNPDWDWDQDDAAVVTLNSPTFRNLGIHTLGSSVSGDATWDSCDVVHCNDDIDLDDSTFRNPLGPYLLETPL